MKDEIKVGDIVWLRSGGPALTVNNTGGEEFICVWFVETRVASRPFRPESLTKENPNRGPKGTVGDCWN